MWLSAICLDSTHFRPGRGFQPLWTLTDKTGQPFMPPKLFLLVRMSTVRKSLCFWTFTFGPRTLPRMTPSWSLPLGSLVSWGGGLLGTCRGQKCAGWCLSPCQRCVATGRGEGTLRLGAQSSQPQGWRGGAGHAEGGGQVSFGGLWLWPCVGHILSWRSSSRGHFPGRNPSVAASITLLPSFLLV